MKTTYILIVSLLMAHMLIPSDARRAKKCSKRCTKFIENKIDPLKERLQAQTEELNELKSDNQAQIEELNELKSDNKELQSAVESLNKTVKHLPDQFADYALYFPNKGVSDYASIWGMRSLTQFTVCFWMKTTATNRGTAFSYAVSSEHNELLIFDYTSFSLYIAGERRETSQSANDGKWHHICVTWRNSDGAWQFFKDGTLRTHGKDFKKQYTIKAGGSLTLGQEQDTIGSKFDSEQSFQGSLSNLNVWSKVLPEDTIKEMSKSCLSSEMDDFGDMYPWFEFLYGIKGGTGIVIPSPCSPSS